MLNSYSFYISQVIAIVGLLLVSLLVIALCAAARSCSKDKRSQESKGTRVIPTPRTRQWVPSEQRVTAFTCACGKLNNISERKCWSCNESLTSLQPQQHTFDSARRCSVCAYYLYSGDRIVITPCCFSQGHAEHLQDWVRTKGSCPSCEEGIKPAHLLRVLPPGQRTPSRRWKPSEQQIRVLICECGKANNPAETVCWSCNKSLTRATKETQTLKTTPSCVACGYVIAPENPIAVCPNCRIQGHKTHLLAIVKTKGKCPACGQRLRTNHLLVSKPQTRHHPRR